VSENTLDLVFNLGDSAWLKFNNAVGFRIVERDTNNVPIRYWYSQQYDVNNGMIRFPLYFSEKNGEVVVQLTDGREIAYSLQNRGKMITPTTVLLNVGNVSALGMRTFRDTNLVYVVVSEEEFTKNINPLSQLVVTESGWIQFSSWINDPKLVNLLKLPQRFISGRRASCRAPPSRLATRRPTLFPYILNPAIIGSSLGSRAGHLETNSTRPIKIWAAKAAANLHLPSSGTNPKKKLITIPRVAKSNFAGFFIFKLERLRLTKSWIRLMVRL